MSPKCQANCQADTPAPPAAPPVPAGRRGSALLLRLAGCHLHPAALLPSLTPRRAPAVGSGRWRRQRGTCSACPGRQLGQPGPCTQLATASAAAAGAAGIGGSSLGPHRGHGSARGGAPGTLAFAAAATAAARGGCSPLCSLGRSMGRQQRAEPLGLVACRSRRPCRRRPLCLAAGPAGGCASGSGGYCGPACACHGGFCCAHGSQHAQRRRRPGGRRRQQQQQRGRPLCWPPAGWRQQRECSGSGSGRGRQRQQHWRWRCPGSV